ncbi:hypothetical protein [Streptomyces sp. bgisy154]|uniref:hypothetical protein n=1 Tax=Streptomyces sp. bgisy154 TaxID=3413794 RepID=UPI003D705E04
MSISSGPAWSRDQADVLSYCLAGLPGAVSLEEIAQQTELETHHVTAAVEQLKAVGVLLEVEDSDPGRTFQVNPNFAAVGPAHDEATPA